MSIRSALRLSRPLAVLMLALLALLVGPSALQAQTAERGAAPLLVHSPDAAAVVKTTADPAVPDAIDAVSAYSFSQISGTYSEITGGTVLGNTTNDDSSFTARPIGFTFNYDGANYTTFSVNSNGFIAMGNTVVNSSDPISGGTTNNVISALGRNLESRTDGELSYLTQGSSPNRTLTVQWKNYQHWTSGTSDNGNIYNFQIVLYETSNIIEVRYGAFTVAVLPPITTHQVGLRGASSADFNNRTGSDWAASTAGVSNTAAMTLNNSGAAPASGQTYTWTPPNSPPTIGYTALTNTSSTANRSFTGVTITDPDGVNTTAGTKPRVYYRRLTDGNVWNNNTSSTDGWKYVEANGATSPFDFTIDYSLLNGGTGVSVGTQVQYFVVAQDLTATPLVGINSGAFAAAPSSVALTAAAFPIGGAINSYPIAITFSGTYTVPGSYPSLTNAGGIFQAINAGVLTGNVVIQITADLTGELGTLALNQWVEEGAGGYTLLIKPSGAPRSITGNINGALIRLNGADRVTIDGSTAAMAAVGGNPALRELTIQNTNTGTSVWVIAVQSGTNGAQNNTIKNVNVLGQDPMTTTGGIALGGNTPGTAGTDNDGNRVENCSVKRAFYGIYSFGQNPDNPNTGTVITQNDLSATGADRIRRGGIVVFNEDGVQITENSIGGIEINEDTDAIGIGVGIQNLTATTIASGGVINAFVSRNKVNGVNSPSTVGYSAAGIAVAGGSGGANTIVNNMITGVTAPSTPPDLVAGIFVAGVTGSDTRLYYNSVSMTGNRGAVANQMPGYGLAVTGSNPLLTLRNNIFYTTQTSPGGANAKSYAVGLATTTFTNLDSNYNAFWSTGANDGGFRTGSLGAAAGTDYADLAAWQTATSGDANSLEVNPSFLDDATNLHITDPGSPVSNVATPIAGITEDFDGEPRTDVLRTPVTPDIGADEFMPANAIELLGFTAEALGLDAVRLNWETATEVNLAGYFVYRSASPDVLGDAVNAQMIASQGVQGQGAAYELIDANLTPGVYYYTLEDVDLSGFAVRHGPVMVEVDAPSAVGLQTGATAGAPGGLPAVLFAVALLLTVAAVWLRRRAA